MEIKEELSVLEPVRSRLSPNSTAGEALTVLKDVFCGRKQVEKVLQEKGIKQSAGKLLQFMDSALFGKVFAGYWARENDRQWGERDTAFALREAVLHSLTLIGSSANSLVEYGPPDDKGLFEGLNKGQVEKIGKISLDLGKYFHYIFPEAD